MFNQIHGSDVIIWCNYPDKNECVLCLFKMVLWSNFITVFFIPLIVERKTEKLINIRAGDSLFFSRLANRLFAISWPWITIAKRLVFGISRFANKSLIKKQWVAIIKLAKTLNRYRYGTDPKCRKIHQFLSYWSEIFTYYGQLHGLQFVEISGW